MAQIHTFTNLINVLLVQIARKKSVMKPSFLFYFFVPYNLISGKKFHRAP